jgi:hypothetical protein
MRVAALGLVRAIEDGLVALDRVDLELGDFDLRSRRRC